MPYYLGIDIGSGTSKGVVIEDSQVKADHCVQSGINYKTAGQKLVSELLKKVGITVDDIRLTVATGQGATSIALSDQCVNDMRCCTRGITSLFPEVRLLIDVEGQSTHVIRLGRHGEIAGFLTSEKCASGSGRFLDIISNVLQIPLENIGPLSLNSQNPVVFTTACAVFGESEAVSRVAEGTPVKDTSLEFTGMAVKISAMVESSELRRVVPFVRGWT